MINSELHMLSGGAGYETQVALIIIGNSAGVTCITSRSGGLRSELMYVQEQESSHSLKLLAPL